MIQKKEIISLSLIKKQLYTRNLANITKITHTKMNQIKIIHEYEKGNYRKSVETDFYFKQ